MTVERSKVLVCFAVKEEARPFQRICRENSGDQDASAAVLVTGMGSVNARKTLQQALTTMTPKLVVSSGFAGGLDPQLKTGDLIFQAPAPADIEARLQSIGAKPVVFHHSAQVASTAAAKSRLRRDSGADAVEMESDALAAVCRKAGIPCLVLRVVLDTAAEDLPLDFNTVMDEQQRIKPGKLALVLARSPGKIGALLRLQRQSDMAARILAQGLVQLLG